MSSGSDDLHLHSSSADDDGDGRKAETSFPIPASYTKHLSKLLHPLPKRPDVVFELDQLSSASSAQDNAVRSVNGAGANSDGTTGTTGTTLWLSAQILSAYLSSSPSSSTATTTNGTNALSAGRARGKRRALELGSGIGYTALTLAVKGWDVVATDIEPVLSTVLRANVDRGMEVVRSSAKRHGVVVKGATGIGARATRASERPGLGAIGGVGSGRTSLTEQAVKNDNAPNVGEVIVRDFDWIDGAERWRRRRCTCCRADVPESSAGPSRSNNRGIVVSTTNNKAVTVFSASNENSDTSRIGGGNENDNLLWIEDDDARWDMIVMTDTFYAPYLVDPLWDTLAYTSWAHMHGGRKSTAGLRDERNAGTERGEIDGTLLNRAAAKFGKARDGHERDLAQPSSDKRTSPPIYIALENRDPRLISAALARGREKGFELRKIGRGRVEKALRDVGWSWETKDWEGVEIWKARWKG